MCPGKPIEPAATLAASTATPQSWLRNSTAHRSTDCRATDQQPTPWLVPEETSRHTLAENRRKTFPGRAPSVGEDRPGGHARTCRPAPDTQTRRELRAPVWAAGAEAPRATRSWLGRPAEWPRFSSLRGGSAPVQRRRTSEFQRAAPGSKYLAPIGRHAICPRAVRLSYDFSVRTELGIRVFWLDCTPLYAGNTSRDLPGRPS